MIVIIMSQKMEALGNLMIPYEGNRLRGIVTCILVLTWVTILVGQAYGLVSPEFNNPVLLSAVMGILGYLFGKEEKAVEKGY